LPAVTTSVVASVVFLRIQDFATRPASEQARLRAQLEAVVAVTTAELAPASRIVLDASDGVAVVVLADPKGALRLAERSLSAAVAGLPLCAGLNHGSVRLVADSAGEAMVGDGIAVAASIAQFAKPSELRITRAFRDALADAAPGNEAALVRKGSFNDASLRTYELFTRDRSELPRRRRTYAALSVVAAFALFATGIGWRISEHGKAAFVHGIAAKYRATTAQGERYVRGLVQKVKFQ
jgi:class 3 adenylate cyclase